MAQSYQMIGGFYFDQNDLEQSKKYYLLAHDYADQNNYTDMISSSSDKLYKIFKKESNAVQALYFLEKFKAMQDSLVKSDRVKVVEELREKYESGKKEQEILLQEKELAESNAEIADQKLTNYIAFGGLGVLFIVLTGGLFAYRQKKKDNLKIKLQKMLVEEKNKEVTDSINYAKRLQDAFLPNPEVLEKSLKDFFILFQPKDIVSGDFYFVEEIEEDGFTTTFITAAD